MHLDKLINLNDIKNGDVIIIKESPEDNRTELDELLNSFMTFSRNNKVASMVILLSQGQSLEVLTAEQLKKIGLQKIDTNPKVG